MQCKSDKVYECVSDIVLKVKTWLRWSHKASTKAGRIMCASTASALGWFAVVQSDCKSLSNVFYAQKYINILYMLA